MHSVSAMEGDSAQILLDGLTCPVHTKDHPNHHTVSTKMSRGSLGKARTGWADRLGSAPQFQHLKGI